MARRALDDVSLAVRAGEIVGIAGVSGNGQEALAELLSRPAYGRRRNGVGRRNARCRPNPRAWIAAGVARIPEDRHAVGVVGDFAVWENAIAERLSKAVRERGAAAPLGARESTRAR